MIKFGQKLKSTDNRNYFVTSDLHFFHKRILEFCSETRPWNSVEEMHNGLIEHWNSKVSQDDVVFHLGDFSFGNKEQTLDILSKLNGHIVHIYGNHAKVLRDQIKVTGYDYLEIKYDKTHIVMNHYAQAIWNRSHYGSCHLFGHSHGSFQGQGRMIDVGWDAQGKILTLHEAVELCKNKDIVILDHHDCPLCG